VLDAFVHINCLQMGQVIRDQEREIARLTAPPATPPAPPRRWQAAANWIETKLSVTRSAWRGKA
jgi:hypothetical protein